MNASRDRGRPMIVSLGSVPSEEQADLVGKRVGSGLLELLLVLGDEGLVDLDLGRCKGGCGDELEGLVAV